MEGREVLHLKSLRAQVYEYLRRAINGGDLAAGSFIDQKRIAAELGISRQTLWRKIKKHGIDPDDL